MFLATPIALAGPPDHARGQRPSDAPWRIVVKFRPGSAAAERAAVHRAFGHQPDRIIPQLNLHAVRVPSERAAKRAMASYRSHPLVEYAEPEVFHTLTATPNDPWFVNWQGPLKRLGVEAAWDITTGSTAVPIAVLDSGLDYNHYEFADRIVTGYDFADNDSDYYDDHSHGTWVTGILGAATNNELGIAGGTWDCPLMVLRSALGLDRVDAIVWATDRGARVISMSFGGYTPTSWEADAMRYAYDRGVVLVAGAGNDGVDNPFYPAAYDTVLAVTGVNASGDPVGYNWGDWVDLVAPAAAMTTYHTAFDADGLGTAGGTSISTPFVAAAAGLVLSVNPDLTPAQVMDILCRTADDVYEPQSDLMTGFGRVNYHAAVLAAMDEVPAPDTNPPVAEIVSPQANATLSGTVTVVVVATDDNSVSRVDLFVDGSSLGGDTVAPHEWLLDTTTLADGSHTLRAFAYDGAGNSCESASLTVTVDNAGPCLCPADCSTPDAAEVPGATCDDGLDNDCDGWLDCDDPDCASDASCAVTACNGNGVCDAGEDCNTCPDECVTGTGPSCGNGICEAGDGEDCVTCPSDCAGRQGGKPAKRFCCGSGGGTNPVGCSDPRCTEQGLACLEKPAATSCCGDGVCSGMETSCNCAIDCGPASSAEETRTTCRDGLDNDCDGAADCADTDCVADSNCFSCNKNGICEVGEDCMSCAADCDGQTKGRRNRTGSSTRYCCGNGILEAPEGDGSICDGNP